MTKTKARLRAEAAERLRMLDKCGSFEYAILGSDKMAWPYVDKRDALVDLLTDDCGPCYSCAKLAELMAENSALRAANQSEELPETPVFGNNPQETPTCGEDDGGLDSREKLEADMKERLGELWADAWDAGSRDSMDDDFDIDAFNSLLDRQEAITHAKVNHDAGIAAREAGKVLRDKIDELEAQLESAHAKNRSLRQHIAKMQEGRHGWHVKYHELEKKNAELQSRVDELTAERDEWKAKAEQAANRPTSQSDAPKTGETAENGATKSEIRDFDDSREKLEADVRWQMGHFFAWDENREEFVGYVLEWLDRQAAITERECADTRVNFAERMRFGDEIDELREDVAERDDIIAVLNAENAELQAKLDELAERKCPGYEPERHYCRYHHQDFELNHQTVSRLKRENASLARDLGECMAERDGLMAENGLLRARAGERDGAGR